MAASRPVMSAGVTRTRPTMAADTARAFVRAIGLRQVARASAASAVRRPTRTSESIISGRKSIIP